MTDILIRHATLVTVDPDRRVIEDGTLAITADRITALGTDAELAALADTATEIIDARGMAAIPGLIDCHSHAGHGLVRSLAPCDIDAWFGACEAIYSRHSDVSFWQAEARLTQLERLMSGVTTCLTLLGGGADIYRTDDPAFGDAHCDVTRESGLRTMLAVGPGRPPFPRAYRGPEGNDTTISFARQMEVSEDLMVRRNGMLTARTGICAIMPVYARPERESVPEPEIRKMSEAVADLCLRNSALFTQDGHRDGTIAYTEGLGVLGPHALLSHSVDLTEADITALKRTGAHIVHNPSAIMSILGRCPVPELIGEGVNVALGSDAAAPDRGYDMFRHMAQCMHYHRRHFADPSWMPPGKVLEMATIDAARALGMDQEIGSLEIGKKADVVFVDLRKPHLYPPSMPLHKLTHFATAADVDTVIVDGQLVLRGRVSQTLDPATVLDEAAEASDRAIQDAGLAHLLAEPQLLWRANRAIGGKEAQ
ncbi:amidohydrolase family protein [Sulfitobacter sp. SK011]|uniref:amidohydrolase family protein n=1 Tax=Sulfitobacter sp. SK011 TaxID=1389004 RepID=UPI000E0A1059|nr:amidohydrolase family protein [Sulfitobacter sp. SK011]AXI43976.1 amidohydrolase [Sulfitobacter sp. SK011]